MIPAESNALSPAAPRSETVAAVENHLEELQAELDALRNEVNILRRRDETLNYSIQRVDEELRLAARLQQDFLPKTLPQLGRVHFHTLFRPASYVSGDLYDVMRLDEKHIGFYMCDAVGHGVPAALLTMFIKNALVTKQIFPGGYRLLAPSETMARLNEMLIEQNLSQATFATAIYGYINIDTGRVTFARGGHPSPLAIRADGSLMHIESDGGLLGIIPGEIYTDVTVDLSAGDRLLIYTDGVEVAFSDGGELDIDRWRAEVVKRQSLSADAMLTDFADYLDNHAGSLAPKDDLTMIVMEVR